MDASGFSALLPWVISHGYLLMFLAMVIEGPAVTAAGAFAATLGHFNIYTVFLISILGNAIPDIIYYAIGYWGRIGIIEKYHRYLGLSRERLEHLEKLFTNHAGKTLFAVKMVPFLATPGLIVAGAMRVPLKKYTIWSLAIILPTSLFFLLIGYYFGTAYDVINQYLNYGGMLAVPVIALFFLFSYLYKKAAKKFAEYVEQI